MGSPEAIAALLDATLEGDDETAAIVIHGLLRARAAGIGVPDEPLASAIDALGDRQHPGSRHLETRWRPSDKN